MPFSDLLSQPSNTNPSYKTLLPNDQLRQVLSKAMGGEEALDRALKGEVSRSCRRSASSDRSQRTFVTTCGSGMTAAVIWLALKELGATDVALYDEVSIYIGSHWDQLISSNRAGRVMR